MTETDKQPRSSSTRPAVTASPKGTDGPGKFWVDWFDPRALAVLGLALVALCGIAAIIAFWANNNPPPVAITRPASGAALNAASLGNVEGTAAPGALVKVYDGATLLGEARADNAGRWVMAIPAGLAAGAHTLKVDATDSANRVTSATLPWTFAAPAAPAAALPTLTKPVIGLPAAGGAFVVGQPINFSGTATPGSAVRLIGPDGRVLGTTTAGADGNWRLDLPAALGIGPIFARVTGPDGVNFDSAPINLTINPAATAVPPTPAPIAPVFGVLPGIFSPGNALKDAPAGVKGPAYESVPEISGSAAPNARIRIYDGDKLIGETTADAKGNWTYKFTAPLAAGAHAFTAASVDGATEGPRSVAQVFTIVPGLGTVGVDVPKLPNAAAITPAFQVPAAGANFVVGQPIDFSGTAAPGATVQIIGTDGKVIGTAITGPDGKWSFKLPSASAGMGPFIVRVTGADGKAIDSAPLALNIAAAPAAVKPAFLGPAAGANFAVGQPIDFTGSAAPGATVQIIGADGKVIGTAIAGPDGKWSFKLPSVSAGMGPFIVRVTGADGKVIDSAPLTLNIAAAPAAVRPAFLGPAAGANVAVGQPIDFTGTAAPGATVQIIGADGKVIGTAITGPDGKWSFKLPAVSAGMGPFIVRVTGADGKAIDSAPLALNIAAAAAPAPAATATPSVLLGVTGGEPISAPTLPLLVGVAGILVLLAASMTRQRVR